MGRGNELFAVVTLNEASGMLRQHVKSFYERQETIPLAKAWGRMVAVDIPASSPLPHFRKSTVDGLAVRAADTFGGSESMPALVQVQGEICMGRAPERRLAAGEGMLIPTGGMLPEGADAVVMVEHLEDFGDGLYGAGRPVAPGENVIDVGEDLGEGEVILSRYTIIRAQEMGLLAAQGLLNVPVLPRWRVGILSTGDEIIAPDVVPAPAQSRDINGYTLLGQALASGCDARYYGIAKDEAGELKERLLNMLAENDLVLLSGGSSVGARDLTAQMIDELGKPGLLFHGLALRPGKPTIGGVVDGKLVIGLPGHPASAMIVFDTLVRPLLDGSLLRTQVLPQPEGRLTQNVYSGTGREEFVRVRLERGADGWLVEPIRGKSGLIRTMVLADGLVHVPLDVEGLHAGQNVSVRLLRRDEG
ncbi:MAG: molybdopterin molybdotransferase MoeA [Desulfitobacteriaceae bacterium]|nr:molybdopterin molybdotransferase MoeA [Desulfitobacteriaceae bacterium]MDI6877873.1 molybdopterin molybdotransferase MoeA [Desulfitobacteriaceae bacterium]MDI6912726.1 molybdopterin molybdotransferase MoeA [Desulfitobacteriaceae bacterium]